MVVDPVTLTSCIVLTVLCFVAIGRAFAANHNMKRACETADICARNRDGRGELRGDADDERNLFQQLESRGFWSLSIEKRRSTMSELYAFFDQQRGLLIRCIEVMPQLGFLGTIVGLIINQTTSADQTISGVGTALYTTGIGLTFYLLSRLLLEAPGDKYYANGTRKLQFLLGLNDEDQG